MDAGVNQEAAKRDTRSVGDGMAEPAGALQPPNQEVEQEVKQEDVAFGADSGGAAGPGQGEARRDPTVDFWNWLPLGLPKGCLADIDASWARNFQGTYLEAIGQWIAAWADQPLETRRTKFDEFFKATTCVTYWADSLINLELTASRPLGH